MAKTTKVLAPTFFKSLKPGTKFRTDNDWAAPPLVKLTRDVMDFESFLRFNAVDTTTGALLCFKDSADAFVEEI